MENTVKLKLLISFDGTNYSGWQWQKDDVTVQAKIEEAFGKIFGIALRIHGSSRTDTGVHALGMVAHAELPQEKFNMPVRKLPLALNARLPEDIRIRDVEIADAKFHAQYDARRKQYRYHVWNHRAHNPLMRHTAWQVPVELDIDAMRTAAKLLVGKNDFRSFATNHTYEIEDTVRTLFRCEIKHNAPLLRFIIEGDGFLYKMCRGIVGTLVQVGQKKIAPEEITQILSTCDRRLAGMTAPAHGLILWKVYYDGDAFDQT